MDARNVINPDECMCSSSSELSHPTESKPLSNFAFRELFHHAVNCNSLDGIQCFLSTGRIITPWDLGVALLKAVKLKDLAMVHILLQNRDVSNQTLSKALTIATQSFSETCASLAKATESHVDALAAKKKIEEIVSLILGKRNFRYPDAQRSEEEARQYSLVSHFFSSMHLSAPGASSTDIDQLLVQTNNLGDEALQQAAQLGCVEMISHLLDAPCVSAHGINKAILLAAEFGHANVLETLLKQCDSLELIMQSLAKIVEKSCRPQLPTEGSLPQPQETVALLIQAISNKNVQISEISDEYFHGIVIGAAKCGDINLLTSCLVRKIMADWAVLEALRQAASGGHIEILKALLALVDKRISPTKPFRDKQYFLYGAILAAAEGGHESCLTFLLKQGLIDSCVRQQVTAAFHKNHKLDAERRDRILVILATIGIAMDVSLQDIEKDPRDFLANLCRQDHLPSGFHLIGEKQPLVFDLGGVSKQVYFTLFSALKADALNISQEGLPYILNEPDLVTYTHLGKMCSMIAEKNLSRKDPFLIGEIFSIHFFALLREMANSTPDKYQDVFIDYALAHNLLNSLHSYFSYMKKPSPENRLAVEQVMPQTVGPEEFVGVEMEDTESDVRKDDSCWTDSEANLFSYLLPIVTFLENVSDSFRSMIQTMDSERLCSGIQGKRALMDRVLHAIQVIKPEKEVEALKIRTDWIKEHIKQAETSWLDSFIFLIAGQNGMADDTAIKIAASDRFKVHTCVSILDVPVQMENKAEFLELLDFCVKHGEKFDDL